MNYEVEYNARSLPPGDVARSFIPPEPHFVQLFSRSHALIVGPRGSGKTTLLKMLTVRALQNWKHAQAAEYAAQITFNAAFIPADIAWGKQIEALDRQSEEHPRREAAFVLHTLRGLTRAMREAADLGRSDVPSHLAHLAISLSDAQEAQYVAIAAQTLGLKPILPTLLGLEIGIESQLNDIGTGSTENYKIRTLAPKLTVLVSTLNGLIGDDDRRWALLVDELEIAPTSIKQFLLSGIRSFDERIVIKLAMAPYMEDASFDASPVAPHPLHDYHTVQLTYSNKEEATQFTKTLFESTFRRLGFEIESLPEIFQSPQGGGFGRRRLRSGRKPVLPPEFKSLAAKDESFADYVEEKGLLKDTYRFAENNVAQDIRKVMPIVIARDYYLRRFQHGGRVSFTRSRKSYALYTGYPSIAEITEGNPRAILTLVAPLAQEQRLRAETSNSLKQISIGSQASAISRVELLLTSLLQVIPLDLGGFEPGKGLLDFIDQIGRALETRLLKKPFATDYVGTFRLDQDASTPVMNAVGKALNAGAIIHVPYSGGGSDSLLRGLRGQRFRLSYALAPRYRLLLTLGDAISLSSLFKEMKGLELTAAQASFFEEEPNDDRA